MKFIDENGIARVRIISPGQGTSAYYKENQLARDGSAFTGGHVHINHPSRSEAKDRPEGDLLTLVGPIVGTPEYEERGPVGPGLYGNLKVASWWRPFVEELGADIGASIRAGGSAVMEKVAELGGKVTKVCERFNPGAEFDLVTKAGRGGKLVPMIEAAIAEASGNVTQFMEAAGFVESDGRSEEERFMEWLDRPKGEEDQMELKEAQTKLTEAEAQVATLTKDNEALTAEKARLAEAIALRDAAVIIAEAVNKKTDLPEATRTRLIENLTKAAPLKEGKLDKEALTTLIEAQIKAEGEYVEAITPKAKPGIKGMGESGGNDDWAGHEARVARKAASYFAERKGTEEECKRMAELFYS